MKVISHVVGFGYSLVAIVDSEEGDHFGFGGGFGEVGDDADSIFVVGEHGSWVTVGGVGFDDAIGFGGYFGFIDGDDG